jgi:hypothetical protein
MSPHPGLTHLQFEAILAAARDSSCDFDFALVAMLGLPGLRIFEATGPTSLTWARNTATACCWCVTRVTSMS